MALTMRTSRVPPPCWIFQESSFMRREWLTPDYSTVPSILNANEIRASKQDEGLVRDKWYPSLGLMTARQKSNSTDGMYVACLAANNGRSHSHNDTGSFIIF